jgi:DNA-binding NarL/FixJ family response regulator
VQPLPPHARLTLSAKERAVCDLLITGATNEDIAATLSAQGTHVATRTVKATLNRAFWRNQIVSGVKRVKLAVYYFREKQGWKT